MLLTNTYCNKRKTIYRRQKQQSNAKKNKRKREQKNKMQALLNILHQLRIVNKY